MPAYKVCTRWPTSHTGKKPAIAPLGFLRERTSTSRVYSLLE
ncbi:hypothetical protein [Acetobacter indonesiensis]|nr:hypothetical protein [Acetobacter indonesiensis]